MKHGRPVPMVSTKAPVRLGCDIVIVAIGQGIESKEFEKQGIPVKRGVIEAMSWSGVKTKDITGVYTRSRVYRTGHGYPGNRRRQGGGGQYR